MILFSFKKLYSQFIHTFIRVFSFLLLFFFLRRSSYKSDIYQLFTFTARFYVILTRSIDGVDIAKINVEKNDLKLSQTVNRSEPLAGRRKDWHALFCSNIKIGRVTTKRRKEIRMRSLGFLEKNTHRTLKCIFICVVGAVDCDFFYHVPDTPSPLLPETGDETKVGINGATRVVRVHVPRALIPEDFFMLFHITFGGEPRASRDNVTVQLTRPIYFWGPRLVY